MATQVVGTNVRWVKGIGQHRHVTELRTANGRVLSRSQVISLIRSGVEEFYALVDGRSAEIVVADRCPLCPANGYIKTTADDKLADHLLSLPTFVP